MKVSLPRSLLSRASALAIPVLLLVGPALRADPCVARCRPSEIARFAVLSDPHLYDARLGTTGDAFEAYVSADPKLLALSDPIFDAAVDGVIRSGARFVLISGDLTKDGELASHRLLVHKLERLERAGIRVYVVPGNHDINNHDAVRFDGASTTPVPTVTPEMFRQMYRKFGYGQAIACAPDSLSYAAEPAPGLRLIALDSTKWAESAGAPHPVVSGRITPATLNWALAQIAEARRRGQKVIAMMHHGVNLHFFGEDQVFGEFLVDDWATVGARLAGAGLRVVFTGHYHSQDAAYIMDATGMPQPTLCDVETASLAMAPCAWRLATLDRSGQLQIETRRVTAIKADLGGVPFPQYAETYLRSLLPFQVIAELEMLFGLPEEQAAGVAPLVVDALVANYAGDEQPSAETQAILGSLLASPEPAHTLGLLLGGLWTDLSPGDNQLVLSLANP